METKVCYTCKIEKDVTDCLKNRNQCKSCASEYKKQYRLKNGDKDKEYRSRPEVKLRNQEYLKEHGYKYKNTPQTIEYRKQYTSRPEVKERRKEKQKIASKTSHYRETRNKRSRERYYNDPDYYFNVTIHKHIRTVEKRVEFTEMWGEVKDIYNMYGIQYHIDHKVPRNWFKSNTPSHIVNDLRNLQVIDAKYNLNKKDKWADPVCQEYLDLIKPYLKNVNHLNW
jgi:hypothetical protein